VLQLFSRLVFCHSLPLSLWVFLLLLTWAHLRQRYQPSRGALYLYVVRQEHALQQGESTIDEFYTQCTAIWCQLDSLRTAVCGTCPCCRTVRSDLVFQRVYEFLSRLC
jgi:hypothetical protein